MKTIKSTIQSVWLVGSTVLVYAVGLTPAAFMLVLDQWLNVTYTKDTIFWFYVAIEAICGLFWSFFMTLARKEMNILDIVGGLMGLIAFSGAFVSIGIFVCGLILGGVVAIVIPENGILVMASVGLGFAFLQGLLPGAAYLVWVLGRGLYGAHEEARAKQMCEA